MSYLDDFCDRTHRFMLHNIVYSIIPKETHGRLEAVVEPRDPPLTIQNIDPGRRNGVTAGGVYKLRIKNDFGPRGMPIYHCGYEQNQSIHLMLGDQARWMFTPIMDGCTFGIGSQNAGQGGAVRVAHCNRSDAGHGIRYGDNPGSIEEAQQAQLLAQRILTRQDVGQNSTLIEPDIYRGMDFSKKATVFGFLDDRDIWSFMALSYTMAPCRHYGLIDYSWAT